MEELLQNVVCGLRWENIFTSDEEDISSVRKIFWLQSENEAVLTWTKIIGRI